MLLLAFPNEIGKGLKRSVVARETPDFEQFLDSCH